MFDPCSIGFAERLLKAGIAPQIAHRARSERRAHYEDLRATALAKGATVGEADAQAAQMLGNDEAAIAQYAAQPNLYSWGARWPVMTYLAAPLATSFAVAAIVMYAFALIADASYPSVARPPDLLVGYFAVRAVAHYVCPVAVAICFGVYALRRRALAAWPVTGMLILVGTFAAVQLVQRGHFGDAPGLPWLPGFLLRSCAMTAAALVPYLWWRRRLEMAIAR